MEAKKLLKAIGLGLIYTFVGYLLSGSSLSWLLGLAIVYWEMKGGKKK